jgi:hypothetical protein
LSSIQRSATWRVIPPAFADFFSRGFSNEFFSTDVACELFLRISVLRTQHLKFAFVSFQSGFELMQLHQIELIPGESICIGHLIVTLLEVDGNEVALKIEDPDTMEWVDPLDSEGICTPELVVA